MSSSPLAIPRRDFLRVGAAAVTAPTIIAATALGTEKRAAPSDRMALAVVGLGSRGFNLIDELLKERDVQIVAVCEWYHNGAQSYYGGRGFRGSLRV